MRHFSSKAALLEAIHSGHDQLEKKISRLTIEEIVFPGSMGTWSVKDILAHLVDWEKRFCGWYLAGKRGEKVETPAPGMTWRDMNRLNQQFYELHKDKSLEQVQRETQASYKEIAALVESIPEEELLIPGYYSWTGKHPLSLWAAANTCDHYGWAMRMIHPKLIRQRMAEKG